MARYCFYCGRELKTGEKCGCRSTGKAGSAPASGQAPTGQAGSANRQSGRPGAAQSSQSGRPGRQASSSRFGNSTIWQRLLRAFNPFADSGRSARTAWHKASRYFLAPADTIRQSAQTVSRLAMTLILTGSGLAGGAFLLLGVRQAHLQLILSLNLATATAGFSLRSQFFLFVQGFGISLSANLLLILIHQLALRLIFRAQIGFRRLLTAMTPAILYSTVFLLGALFLLSGSPYSALLTVAAGLAASTVAQYLALRQVTGFDDNRCLILVCLILLLYTGSLALLLNLSLPVINALLDHSAII
jgi:hypothetical protein